MSKKHDSILVADDDADFAEYLRTLLSARGHSIQTVASGAAALEAVASLPPDLAILDIELGDASGLDICRRLKRQPSTARMPVMIVTGHDVSPYWTTSLRFGADLFMTKTSPAEQMSAAVEALLARVSDRGAGAVTVGRFTIDPAAHSIALDGRVLDSLGTKLFDLAFLLVMQGGRVLERQEIMRRLRMTDVRDNEVNVLMHVLRRKLGPRGKDVFKTVRGLGYRFDEAGCR